MAVEVNIGDIIKEGQVVLLTSGEYSSYSVVGVFRATRDIEVPGKKSRYGSPYPDLKRLSVALEEIPYIEVHE